MTLELRPRPSPAQPQDWRFPEFERSTMPNGMSLLACRLPGRPIAEVRVILGQGVRDEPRIAAGAAGVAAEAVCDGTSPSSEKLAVALESLGATFEVRPEWDAVVAGLAVPVGRIAGALSLVTQALVAPTFESGDIARIVRKRLGILESEQQDPRRRAKRTLASAMFAPSSRMALPRTGDTDGLRNVTLETVERFWKAATTSSCTIIVVGDVRLAGLEAAVDQAVAGWNALGASAPVSQSSEPTAESPSARVVDIPGSVQTALAVGTAGRPIPLDKRAAVRCALHYLGGPSMHSRLNQALREERHIAYGAYAGGSNRRTASTLTAETSVQTNATAEAVGAIVDEVRAVRDVDRIDADAFSRAVDNLVRTATVGYKSGGAVATALVRMTIEGLPDDYHDRVLTEIAATTRDGAAAALREFLDATRLHVAAVGDAAATLEPLERLADAGVIVQPTLFA